MKRESVELGYLLKNVIGDDFSMDDFDSRLRLQKSIYLLQAFDVNLGYSFAWYLRGPYCPLLADNGFEINDVYHRIPKEEVKFTERKVQRSFERFQEFINRKDVDALEIAASLHYQIKILGKDEMEAKEKTANKKRKQFDRTQVDVIFEEMGKCGLL